ncbi:response regulator [Oleiphilus messinensis]|uniref:Response regulator n=1 Tax=Oleiphilus messinensis TaxID=141451 RepID=A0A1Y0IDS1_9GAMM|nr:response regulator [Oleiphilus messinensis]ARU58309.1 response regulator [Oleiphilus messinensis]
MPNLDLPILVVDDAKFSSTVIGKTLTKSGYRDIRFANNAQKALEMIESRPVSVLIADWLMPEMDGLEMAARVRQVDEQINHFTYVILLTAKEGVEALSEAFDRGVDDFIYKSDMSKQLLPRIFAADRIADMQNSLLLANQLLLENNKELEEKNIIDLETGLGNQRYCLRRLSENLRETEARGGASSYLLIGIKNWQQLKSQYSPAIMEEIAVGVSRRLRHLIRPMDAACRISENQFAVVTQFKSLDHCTVSCFRRIHEGISLKAFKTTAGFISIAAGTSVCAADNQEPMPTAHQLEKAAFKKIPYAYETGSIFVSRWFEVADEIAN